MSWLVETDPRHRCILAHWHSIMLWEVSRVGHWAHYLSPISEGPLARGSGPIAASVSASEAKSNRCLPRCWVEKISCLEPLWNTLMEKKRRVERWTKIENSEGSQERWKKQTEKKVQNRKCGQNVMWPSSCAQEGLSKEIWTLIWTVQSNTCWDTGKSTQPLQTALLQRLAFSFQRIRRGGEGMFDIPKENVPFRCKHSSRQT